jgi:hypothetical protein
VSKQGRKADLIDRILAQCGDMTSPLATKVVALATNFLAGPRDQSTGGATLKAPAPVVPQLRVQCVCNSVHQGSVSGVVRCSDCAVIQHLTCVMARPYDSQSIASYVCEVCRLNEVDPTCKPVGEPRRLSALFHHQSTALTSTRHVQTTLRLSPEELALLSSGDRQHQLRLYAIDIAPPIPAHRWPVALALTVNTVEVETRVPPPTWDHYTNRYKVRPVDEVLVLSDQAEIKWQPHNVLVFDAVVQTSCVVVAQLVRAITPDALFQQLLVANAPPLETARARLLERCFPEHEDDDLTQMAVNLSLRCPLTLMRVSTPARSSECAHPECFDLEAHLQMQFTVRAPHERRRRAVRTTLIARLHSFGQVVAIDSASPADTDRCERTQLRRARASPFAPHALPGCSCAEQVPEVAVPALPEERAPAHASDRPVRQEPPRRHRGRGVQGGAHCAPRRGAQLSSPARPELRIARAPPG